MPTSPAKQPELSRVKSVWERLGRDDPMWAVLTEREEWDEREFFATGERDVDDAMSHLASVGIRISRGSALDFGCGLGRISRALGKRFDRVVGVDVAESMLEAARRLNGDQPNCDFRLNTESDLSAFEPASFDLVLSRITLQHMPPDLARGYVSEFLRVVSSGGAVVFQLVAGQRQSTGTDRAESVRRKLRKLRRTPIKGMKLVVQHLTRRKMETYCTPRDEVESWIRGAGGHVVDVRPDTAAGPLFESYTYVAVRDSMSQA
jgi:SAM-dependent methyltransferase